jgi:hypothetical protein
VPSTSTPSSSATPASPTSIPAAPRASARSRASRDDGEEGDEQRLGGDEHADERRVQVLCGPRDERERHRELQRPERRHGARPSADGRRTRRGPTTSVRQHRRDRGARERDGDRRDLRHGDLREQVRRAEEHADREKSRNERRSMGATLTAGAAGETPLRPPTYTPAV